MTNLETRLDELRAVAEKATPGEWEAYSVPDTRKEAGYCAVGVGDSEARIVRYEGGWFDAAHIATFDPPTVLALIEALGEVVAKHRRAHAVYAHGQGSKYLDPCPDCDGKAGVHACGCWADTDIEYVCAECHRLGSLSTGVYDYTWPCPTIRALNDALGVES